MSHLVASEIEERLNALRAGVPDLDSAAESQHLISLLDGELSDFLAGYDDYRIEGVGGSGIVLSAIFTRFSTRRAIKIPRKHLYETPPDKSPEVDPEIEALAKVSHQHVTRLFDSQKLKGGVGHCAITEYVKDPFPLDRYAHELCCSAACRRDPLARARALRSLAEVIKTVVDAVLYLHDTAHLLHFDLKPDNILCSADGHAFVTDLGFARDLGKSSGDTLVDVGFTYKYAHLSIRDPDRGARVSRNPAKSRNQLRAGDLTPIIDLFAFGRTLQECLKRLEDEYKEAIHSEYTFNFLHLLACLCLDGMNGVPTQGHDFVSDQALGLPLALFSSHKFTSFQQLSNALDRLLGRRRLEQDIPETDPWSSGTINVSDMGVTALTPRLQTVLNHPVFQRLSSELQLGMLETVFPTATHTRFQHTLGVFHATCDYLRALYYDPENPTFRVVFDEPVVRSALVASLAHDLGQTTFGHELEEVDGTEFSHEDIGVAVLEKDQSKDGLGRTLRTVIESDGTDCWDLKLERVVSLLRGKPRTPLEAVLHDILDGQLDADKLDYLIRDSVEARVRYGQGIDYERFLRSLTSCAGREDPSEALRLAVKRKGAASAEAFAFARYQLYQSLYWHHTFRAVKGMLVTAGSEIVEDIRAEGSGNLAEPHPLRTEYLIRVVGIALSDSDPIASADKPRSRSHRTRTMKEVIRERLATQEAPNGTGKYASDPTISFLYALSRGKARFLLQDVVDRRYYKRIIEIPLSDFKEQGWADLRETFRSASKRIALRARVEEVLLNTLRTGLQAEMPHRPSLTKDETLEKLETIAAQRFAFVLDLPTRGWTAAGDEPRFVSDYKRRHFRTDAAGFGSYERSALWVQHIAPMMRTIAMFRVYAHPEVLEIVKRVLDAATVRSALKTIIPSLPDAH